MKYESLLTMAPFSGTRVHPFKGKRRYLSTGGLQETTVSFDEVTYTDRPSRADIFVSPGDVLFARMQDTVKVLEIDHSLADIIVSTGFAVLRPTKECDGKFLMSYLKSDYFERKKRRLCSGAIQPAITNASIVKITVPFPPLVDQKRMGHLLCKVEELIIQRKLHLRKLEDLLKSVFLKMFGDPIDMRNQPRFLLKDYIEFLTSGSRGWAKYYVKSGSVFLRINNVKDARLCLDDIVYVNAPNSAEAERSRVKGGDLLLSITADLGRTAIVPKELEGAYINQHLALIRILSNVDINPLFLAWYLTMPYGKSFIHKKRREGVKAGLNFDDIRGLQIVKPPLTLQNQFAAIVEKGEALKLRYQKSLDGLETLYAALSQKVFKGELDLSKVPLPMKGHESIKEETLKVEVKRPVDPLFKVPALIRATDFQSSEGRKELINEWAKQMGSKPLTAQLFMEGVEQEDDVESGWGKMYYDKLKACIFEALEKGCLIQKYDDDKKIVQITTKKR